MSGNETVFGGGTPPKPEDETYLSLLKGSIRPKIKIKIKKDVKIDTTHNLSD